MFCWVGLCLLLSPQPTILRHRCKHVIALFQLEMKKHRRFKQMYDYKRRKKSKLNSSTMHRALRYTCSLKSPPSLFPPNPNQFCDMTWPLLPSPISLSLLIVVIFLFSCVCKVLCIMPPHFHFLRLYSLCLFVVCDPLLFLFMLSPCLGKSVCWIGSVV